MLSAYEQLETSLAKYTIRKPLSHHTKTCRYLFRMFMYSNFTLYFTNSFLNMWDNELFNVYLGDVNCQDYFEQNPVLYITVPHKHEDHEELIEKLEEMCPLYIDNYMLDTERTVIRLKFISEKVFRLFQDSKYSKMYPLGEPNSKGLYPDCPLTEQQCINLFLTKEKDFAYIDSAYHVMIHSQMYHRFLCNDLIIKDEEVQKVMWSNELESILDLEKEILNYKS